MSRIVTLTSDFGTQDAYVGAMKGVILGVNPDVRLVDVTHDISPQDVMEAAFVLKEAAFYFPAGSIHLAVVDPGVGTERRPVALRSGDHFFVGPDNGLFALILHDRFPDECIVLDRSEYWRTQDASPTFHGRDVFAPVAAYLSRGIPLEKLGSPIEALTPLHWALPITDEQGIQGWIVHVDRFGNCITNVTRRMIDELRADRVIKCFAGSAVLEGLSTTYGQAEPGEPLMHFNSGGVLEIAINSGNASELLGIRKGATINLVFRVPR